MSPTSARRLLASLGITLAAGALACALPRAGTRDGPAAAALSGTVTYRPRIALPSDAVVHVRVQEASRVDAPATTIAERSIPTDGRQVPIPFSLVVPRDGLDARDRLVVRAEIRSADGALLWTTDTRHELPATGPLPEDLELVVVQAGAGRSVARGLVGPTGRLVRIETADRRTIVPDSGETYTVGHIGTQAYATLPTR